MKAILKNDQINSGTDELRIRNRLTVVLTILYFAIIVSAVIIRNFPAKKEISRPMSRDKRGMIFAISYLLIIAVAVLINIIISPVYGILLYSMILLGLIVHSSLIARSSTRNLIIALCLAPLIGILSLSVPPAQLPQIYWYCIIYPALFLAAFEVMRYMNSSFQETGLNFNKLGFQTIIAFTGIILGTVEYYILKPSPLISGLTFSKIILPAVILLLGTGFVEEFIFRGVMQSASIAVLGRLGIIFVAMVFTALNLAHYASSPWDILFVFLVSLYFGWMVNKTGSILGVALAHGLINILLYLVLPFLL